MTVPTSKEHLSHVGDNRSLDSSAAMEEPIDAPVVGKVVRLHFACRAPLPLGYQLRVTSSTLWAPSAQGALAGDDAAAEAVSSSVANDAYHSGSSNAPGGSTGIGSATVRDSAEVAAAAGNQGDAYSGGVGVYASSVEMVTTPETYPVWRTRRPVAVVVRSQQRERRRSSRSLGGSMSRMSSTAAAMAAAAAAAEIAGAGSPDPRRSGNLGASAASAMSEFTVTGSGGKVQHHRYRYLVVAPGWDAEHDPDGAKKEEDLLLASAATGMDLHGSLGTIDSEHHQGDAGGGSSSCHESRDVIADLPGALRTTMSGDTQDGVPPPPEPAAPGAPCASMVQLGGREGGGAYTTHEDGAGSLPVAMWEDPFGKRKDSADEEGRDEEERGQSRRSSAASLRSLQKHAGDQRGGADAVTAIRDLANLPYRTLDIAVGDGTVLKTSSSRGGVGDGDDDDVSMEGADDGGAEYTEDGVRIDVWQSEEDEAFHQYVVREAINEQNRADRNDGTAAKRRTESDVNTDISESESGTYSPRVQYYNGSGVEDSNPPSSAGSRTSPSSSRPKQRIFFVCFHLPVIVRKDQSTGQWTATWNESLMAKTEGSGVVRKNEAHWMGTVTANPPIKTARDREAVKSVLAGMDCTPLFIEEDVKNAHYLGMCKQILWPAFHNIDLMDICEGGLEKGIAGTGSSGGTKKLVQAAGTNWDQGNLGGWWAAFRTVNGLFANLVNSVLRPGDIMWVHDYHLALLPHLTYDAEVAKYGVPVTKKVFFLHIPFCSSVMFKELEAGDPILRGMLHADVVGFHTFDYARHFLSAAKRLVGVNYESLVGGLIGLKFRGRTVLVTMHNVSVEPMKVDAALTLPSVSSYSESLRHKHRNRRVIVGVDIAQALSGLTLKLLAFEKLLQDYPVWKDRVVLVQRALVPGSRPLDEVHTCRELRFLVNRIKKSFGPAVIDYEEVPGSSLPIDRRLALWSASEVMIITAVREGLNMLPLEYIYARKPSSSLSMSPSEKPKKRAGVIIASEFCAVCSILNGAVRINPFDLGRTASAIDKALTMDDNEREGRRHRDAEFVSSSPSAQWAANVLRDMKEIALFDHLDDEEDGLLEDESEDAAAGVWDPKILALGEKREVIDSTAAFLAKENEISFSHLSTDAVVKAYNSTTRRVIICDFNGTIVIKEPPGKYLKRDILGSSGNKPPAAVIKALADLCSDPHNTVFVVSGDAQETVEDALGTVPGLGLAASNGACFARPLRGGETRRTWQSFDLGVDWEAVKKAALPIMSKFTARTNGSFVKLTHSSLGWSYYSCDPEWGLLQASHLVLELEDALRAFDVRFVTLKGVIEVVPRMLNKGLIVKKALREVAARRGGEGVDFVLVMGDDISDEKMFTAAFSFASETDVDVTDVVPSPDVIGGGGDVGGSNDPNGSILATGSEEDDDNVPMMDEQPLKTRSGPDNPLFMFTAAVGKKPTHASNYVNDAWDVGSLLVTLSGGDESALRRPSPEGEEADGADFFA